MPARQPQEAGVGELGLDPVLLEEHPALHARAREAGRRQELRSLAQVQQDRARLGDPLAGVELQHRHAPVGVAREVLLGSRLAREEVDRHTLERHLELAQQDAGLHAVPGRGMVVEDHARERYPEALR